MSKIMKCDVCGKINIPLKGEEMGIIYSKESDELINTINSLISGNNAWEEIKEVFDTDKIGNKYFEDARKEVLESGNQGYSMMVVVALRNMCDRIYDLESENRKLKNI